MGRQLNPKQFQNYLDRDKGCLHCGEREAVSPQHRANRGMGGSKQRDVPSNIIVLCSFMNGAIESNPRLQTLARTYGWKLSSWDDPIEASVYDTQTGKWFLLDDGFSRNVFIQEGIE